MTDRGLTADSGLAVGLVWMWVGTGSWFWWLAASKGALLPYVPAAVWFVPGVLWRAAPPLPLALAVAASVAAIRGGRSRAIRVLRWPMIGGLALVAAVAAVWGTALVVGSP